MFILTLLYNTSAVQAGPAPKLTKVQFLGVTFYDNLFGVEIIPSTYTTGDTFTGSTHSLNKSEITSVPPIHLTEEKIKELEEKAKKEKQEIN